jgi:pyruvate dehydrogenase E1 component alpha subunit
MIRMLQTVSVAQRVLRWQRIVTDSGLHRLDERQRAPTARHGAPQHARAYCGTLRWAWSPCDNERTARTDASRAGQSTCCAVAPLQPCIPVTFREPLVPIAAKFEIEYLQYLDPEGKQVRKDLPDFAKDVEQMVELYRLMVSTRVFDTKSIALQRTGKLGTYASCLGHEATHVGIGASLKPEDVFAPSYREYGAQLYRGVRPRDVYMYWGGDERGNDYQNEPAKHDFAWSVPIGTQCLHAAGTALAFKIRKEKRVAVCTIGDGGSSKADFYGAINVAGARDLPLVAAIVNNQWAISVPRRIQSGAKTLAQKGIAAGLHCIQVDGNDIIAVKKAMTDAVERARKGQGGSVVECVTYRLGDHTTADDARRYRGKQEVEDAWKKDPVKRLRIWLESKKAWNKKKEEKLQAECDAWMDDEVNTYLQTKAQPVSAIFDYTFAELPANLVQQRAAAIALEGGH